MQEKYYVYVLSMKNMGSFSNQVLRVYKSEEKAKRNAARLALAASQKTSTNPKTELRYRVVQYPVVKVGFEF